MALASAVAARQYTKSFVDGEPMTARRGVETPWPTDVELDILQVLWGRGPCTVREVHETLYAHEGAGYTTALMLQAGQGHLAADLAAIAVTFKRISSSVPPAR